MTDNIIPMREPRAKRLRKALDAWYRTTEEWVERTLELAVELKAARDECGGDDIRFGHWLVDNNCDDFLYKNERAALIHMAEHIELSRDVLRLTDRKSVRYIWENEIQPIAERRHLSLRRDRSSESSFSEESAETASTGAENCEVLISPSAIEGRRKATRTVVSRNSRLHGRPRADDVLAIFTEKNTRTLLGKTDLPVWNLIVRALDSGLLPHSTDNAIRVQSMRLIFPYGSGSFCNRYDLTDKKERTFVSTELFPQMVALKDHLLAEPERLEEILNQDRRDRERKEQTAVVEQRARKALAALPPDETEVIMFGKRMWPLVLGETVGTYDFKTLQVAVWKFTDLNRSLWLGEKNPVGRAIMIRNSTKWDRHFIGELTKNTEFAARIDRIYSLVHALCSLMEQNPNGECREPMTPLVLG